MIKLTKNWRIDNSNPPEVVLQEHKGTKIQKDKTTKVETVVDNWVNIAYCISYPGVFKAYLMQHTAGASTIEKLLKRIAEVEKLFKDTLDLSESTQETKNGNKGFVTDSPENIKRTKAKVKANNNKD